MKTRIVIGTNDNFKAGHTRWLEVIGDNYSAILVDRIIEVQSYECYGGEEFAVAILVEGEKDKRVLAKYPTQALARKWARHISDQI